MRWAGLIPGCLALIGLAFAPRARALDPSLRITQYGHSAWRLVDGILPGIPLHITQTRDGYLWIGTTSGLVRFDGVRFVNFVDIEGGQPLPSSAITTLHGTKDGTLWIGSRAGLARWAHGTLENVDYPADLLPARIVDAYGSEVWVANHDRNTHRAVAQALCRVGPDACRCFTERDGLALRGNFSAAGLAVDADGSVLLGTASSVLRWRPGGTTTSFELEGAQPGRFPNVVSIARDQGGDLWAGVQDNGSGKGLMRLLGDRLVPAHIGALDEPRFR